MNDRIQSISEFYVEKKIGGSKATTDTIPSKFLSMFKVYFTLVIMTLINL